MGKGTFIDEFKITFCVQFIFSTRHEILREQDILLCSLKFYVASQIKLFSKEPFVKKKGVYNITQPLIALFRYGSVVMSIL